MSSATETLKELAVQVMNAVQSVDLEHDVAAALDNLVITCHGPGQFNIQIQTNDDSVRPHVLEHQVRTAVVGEEDDDE